ncbi:MAG: diadenylate cyclase CdaA [Bacteroidales bacterium]|nr:diadenylate cyclase CdaA [Bacteroidales bacterium]
MLQLFIQIRIIDIIDILLVAYLMYQVYLLIRGTVAFNIFVAVIGIWVLYIIVNNLKMKLLSSILGAIIGGGAIALIILFQQEIRRFMTYVGSRYFSNRSFSIQNLFNRSSSILEKVKIESIHKACLNLAESYTGALIVVARKSSLNPYAETGDLINANTSSRLLESIFLKNGPLHDGAAIIENNTIVSARCVLPFTNKTELPPLYGMRHRAGLGISEQTDAFVIIVSEERGEISVADHGQLITGLGQQELWHILKKTFG